MKRTKVFISYSHQDERWRRALTTHLAVLEFKGLLHVWSDTRINAGDNWIQQLESAMDDSRVAVLLVSPSFLASQFIQTEEIPRLLGLHAKDGMRILPLLARPCAWQLVPWLSDLQARPKDGRTLSSGSEHQVDVDLSEFTYEIASLIQRFEQAPSDDVNSACVALEAAYDSNLRRTIDERTLISLLGLAIERGAPVYNSGSPKGCATIYRHAADCLLKLVAKARSLGKQLLAVRGVKELETLLPPLITSTNISNPAEADRLAWQLREAFDCILAVARRVD